MNRFVTLYQSVREKLGDGSLNPLVQVKAQSKSQNGFQSLVKIRDFELIIDQPRGFEGENMGPKPSEVLLAALAASLAAFASSASLSFADLTAAIALAAFFALSAARFLALADIPVGGAGGASMSPSGLLWPLPRAFP